MNVPHTVGGDVARGVGRFAAHLVAIVLGLILSVAGLGMGVTIALLPIGIPVGLLGLALLIWGLFGGGEELTVPPYPPK